MLSLPDAIDVIRPSVVQVMVGAPGVMAEPAGTGVIIDDQGFVLTAGHVTRDARTFAVAQGWQSPKILVGLAHPNAEKMRGNFTAVDGQVIEEDDKHDLALLKMSPNPFEGQVKSGLVIGGSEVPLFFKAAKRSVGRPRDGLPIAVSGYPLREMALVTTSGALASAWSLEMQQITIPGTTGIVKSPVGDSYLADVSINPGNSGGPVYQLEDGAVIGVCVAFRNTFMTAGDQQVVVDGEPLTYNSGLSVVVPISYGEELLSRHIGN